ncbi:hypothetical protein R83H12_00515 [Fibrobacteria bacterium R8-3-H12]
MSTKAMFGTALAAIAALFSSSMAQSGNTNYTVPLTGLGSSNKALDMVFVEGGTYKRGCSEGDTKCESTEKPAHNVTLSSYYVGKYEITNAQWVAVMGGSGTKDDKPKTSITWYDAIGFTCKLREQTGKNYRLLTDAEFEYAARGGKKTKGYLYSGSNNADDVSWNSSSTFPPTCYGSGQYQQCFTMSGPQDVGSLAANELGTYDMSGNVYEWTHDSWGNYNSNAGDLTNPIDRPVAHTQKTRRGGSYDQLPADSRVSARKIRSIEGKDGSIGFRIALSVNDSDPAAQIDPCSIHQPPPSGGKPGFRDERLITKDDEVWAPSGGYGAILKIKEDGSAIAGSIYCSGNYCMTSDSVSGEWYTANCMALNIVRAGGTSKKFIYYLIDLDNMSMMPEGGMPGRFERKKMSEVSNAAKLIVPTIASPKPLDQLVPSNVKNIDMKNPPTTGRDSRLIEGPDFAWIQDNVAMGAGGTHRYRKDFDSEAAMRFVVWDKGAYTALAQGPWFTVDNIFLRVNDNTNNETYDYLYTVAEDGKTLYHISFQAYEPGDFRMFQKKSANADSAAKYGWTEPSKLSSTFNQGVSTYYPPDEDNYTPPSSDRDSDKPTPILSQIAKNNLAMQIKNGTVLEIYNIKGNLISRQNLTNLPKGVYIVKVRFGSDVKILRVPVL